MSDAHDMRPIMSNLCDSHQLSLDLKTWGGKRRNSGRKPKGARPLLRHSARPRIAPSTPVHVTIRMRPEIRNLRTKDTYRVIARALAAAGERFGLRVVHHSVQSNHLHLIAEAADAHALGRGMQGLGIRIAKRLNALARRRGSVLADRYHVHVLRTPREVRHALLYVLNNGRKHAAQHGLAYGPTWLDPYSSPRRFRRLVAASRQPAGPGSATLGATLDVAPAHRMAPVWPVAHRGGAVGKAAGPGPARGSPPVRAGWRPTGMEQPDDAIAASGLTPAPTPARPGHALYPVGRRAEVIGADPPA